MSGAPITAAGLVKRDVQLGSLPSIFSRINSAVNNSSISVSGIASIVSEDPSLSARLLRLANSSFIGLPTKVETISRAVIVLGTQQLRDLALATSVIQLFKGIPEEFVTMESFWRHSISTAMTARVLAAQRRHNNVEKFFVSGILHDIGRLIMFKKIPGLVRQAIASAEAENIPLYQAERQLLGFDHAEVGRELAEQWFLPQSLSEAIAHHHRPTNGRKFPEECAIVHAADIISHAAEFGSSGEHLIPPLNEKTWKQLEIPEDSLEPMIEKIDRELAELIDVLVAN